MVSNLWDVIERHVPFLVFRRLVKVFHWHGETFDLPSGATRLAKSDGCENQAFQIGKSVIGLQFHLETTPEAAREIVSHCRDELVPSKYIQTEEEILSAKPERYTINKSDDGQHPFFSAAKRWQTIA